MDPSSPFEHLLHTNYIPTCDEAAEIRKLCANPLKELARLKAEISQTQALLHDLQRSYSRSKTRVDAHLALLSPMRSVPPEILQSIFIMTLPSDRNAVMHASETPVLLGRVCRGWRKIAYATPELWASIHLVAPPVDFSESAISPGDIRLMAMEEWLARSAVCPLSISIWVSREAWGAAAAAAASPFVEAILPLSSRWKHIELQVPSDSLDSFHYLQATDVPLLQTLSITNGGSLARDDWSGNLLFLQHAPRLHTLLLAHDGNVSLPFSPWEQLTSLSLCPTQEFFGLDAETTVKILSQCLNLRTCTLHFPPFQPSPPAFPGRLHKLPHLSVLAVRATDFHMDDYTLSNVLDAFILPSLEFLDVEDRNGDFFIYPALFRLLSRSSCHLRKLELNDIIFPAPDSISLLVLPAMRSVVELVVRDRTGDEGDCVLSETFIGLLADCRSLCPDLRVVKFTQCSQFSDQSLFKFLKARSGPLGDGEGAGLQSAEISFCREAESPDEVGAVVQELAEAGLEANICHENDEFWDVFRVSPWEGLSGC
ncbi:hypothetical protein B0H14DRAFT_2589397 [Mycena olivaceomarginata]|nr:hypothetical protein B0H14DRAFT_2589397 [Mycena olivaceomarginata]